MSMFKRRVWRVRLFGLCIRLTVSPFQTISMLLVAGLVYSGSLIEASTYNSACAPPPGELRTWARPMPLQAPPFSAFTVLVGLLLMLPCLVLIRKRIWRLFTAATSLILVLTSASFFYYAFGPIGCVNSGGNTDDFDASGIFLLLVYAVLLLVDYFILVLYAMDRATAAVRQQLKKTEY